MAGNRSGWAAVTAVALMLLASVNTHALDRLLATGDTLADGTPVLAIRAYAIGAGGAVAARVQSGVDTATQAIIVRAGGRGWVTVARTGVGAPGGGIVQALGRVAIGIDGTAIVRADVARTDGSTSGEILSCDLAAVCRRLVGTGDRAPSSSARHFTAVDVPVVNDDGIVAFRGTDDGDGAGLYRIGTNGSITTLVSSGDAMPDGGTFATFGGPALANDGAVAFFATGPLNTGTRKAIFLRTAAGELRSIVGVGDTAAAGGMFTVVQSPAIADGGVVTFRTTRLGDDAQLHDAVMLLDANGLRTVVQQDDVGPGGAPYIAFDPPEVADDGTVAVRAVLALPPMAVVAIGGSTQLFAGSGTSAPFGGIYASFGDPVVGPRGRVVFSATVESGNTFLLADTIGGGAGEEFVAANCSVGGSLAAALLHVADEGTVSVTGTCHESLLLDDDRRIHIVGAHHGRRRVATLVAADDGHPALDVRATAGALTVEGLAIESKAPLRLRGVGHVLQDLDVKGAIDLGGSAMQLDALRVRGAENVCLAVDAADSRVSRTRLLACAGDGVTVTADRVVLDQVVAQGARGRGGVIASNDDQILRCRFVANRGTGLRVTGGGSTLTGNRVMRNRAGGLLVQGCNQDGGRNRAAGNRGGPNRDFQDCRS